MSVNAGDLLRITAVMEGPSGKVENTYQFVATVVIIGDDVTVMNDLAQKLDDAYDLLGDLISSDLVFQQVEGFNVTQNHPMPSVSWPVQTTGQGGANSTAAQVAGLALLRTGRSRAVGRKFIGGMDPLAITGDGFLTSTAVTRLAALGGELLGSFISGSLNTYLPGINSVVSGGFLSFIESLASSIPATQRRRRSGRGV